jgi:hypothetical protein
MGAQSRTDSESLLLRAGAREAKASALGFVPDQKIRVITNGSTITIARQ